MPFPIIPIVLKVLSVADFVNDIIEGEEQAEKTKEMERTIKEIAAKQNEIIGRLKALSSEMQWQVAIATLDKHVTNIQYKYHLMMKLKPNQRAEAKEWAERALDMDLGIDRNMFKIHSAMMGETIMGRPLMQLFKEKIQHNPSGQSAFWEYINHYHLWVKLQTMGMILIANAIKVLDPNTSKDEIEKRLRSNYADNLNRQYDKNADYQQGNDEYYHNPAWGACADMGDWDRFFDSHVVVADAGFLVCSMALYQKNNRVALKIEQARPVKHGEVDSATRSWKVNNDWGEEYLSSEFVHTLPNQINQDITHQIPVGRVITGARLQAHNNRVALALQSAELDWDQGVLNEASRQWHGPEGWEEHYFRIGDVFYANTSEITPAPLSYVTGATLFQFGNRVGIKVRTRFFQL